MTSNIIQNKSEKSVVEKCIITNPMEFNGSTLCLFVL